MIKATPTDAIAGLSERLRDDIAQLVTAKKHAEFAGAETGVRVKDPSLLLTDLTEAATALDALHGEISQWANEVARYKAYAEKFDEENAALQADLQVKEQAVADMARTIDALQARVKEADEACQRLCDDHGFATGHGDSVVDMIDEISAQVKKLIYVPGSWHCPKCKFTLLQSNLNAQDGTVTARDTPGDKCPNCNGPLWRCTWKNDAFEMQERAVEQMERAKAAESRATSAEQERDEAYERAAQVAEGLQCRNCNSVVPSGDDLGLCCGRPDYDSISDVSDAIRRLAAGTEKEPSS